MQRVQMNKPWECGLISLLISIWLCTFFHFSRTTLLTTTENTITYHNALCLYCHPRILHKHCLQFLLGVKMAPRETENNAYAKNKEHYGMLWYLL